MSRAAESPRVVHGAASWRLASDCVEGFLTREGGHLGPVFFNTDRGRIQPFALSPWQPHEVDRHLPAVLRPLRGDFFCAPFGGNAAPFRGERHPVHGETAGQTWRLVTREATAGHVSLSARLTLRARPGRVTKRIVLRAGEPVVYQEHVIEDCAGPMCLGHHAMLAFPAADGSGRIATSPFRFGRTVPRAFEDPARGGYSSLQPGAWFRSLRAVPIAAGGTADLSRYPARAGFTDLVQLAGARSRGPAWTAVTFGRERWLWFALRDPQLLTSTLFWHSNGGRHYPPWNGRHRRILGLEDVTAYFDYGLAESARPNDFSRRGIATTLPLRRDRPLRIPYVMGVLALPRGFDSVRSVRFMGDRAIFTAVSGRRVVQTLDRDFLFTP
ncbi:MAG TPA: hypothetical protein PLG56_01670 [Lacunisphaera sp.]|jgi:hypothetical protein|nr:hypothetical protein [Lacunisphaera sp.]